MKYWKTGAVLAAAAILGGCVSEEKEMPPQEGKKTVLSILAGQSTPDAGIEDMITEAVEAAFPQVKLEWECVDWGEQFDAQMQARFSSGDIPDIMIGKAQDVYNYYSTGNLGPIRTECGDKINKTALDAVTVDGMVYGIPYNAWYQGVIYNKNVFKQYHLEPPHSLKELEQIVKTLEMNQVIPFACHLQESWKLGNMTMQLLMNSVFKENPDWGEDFRKGKDNFSGNRAVRECFLQNRDIMEASWPDAMDINQFESDSRFAQGEAAMYLSGSWSMQFASQYDTGMEFGIFPYPNETGDSRLIKETNLTFMKSARTENSERVDQIFSYLLEDKKLAAEITDFTQSFPMLIGVEAGLPNVLWEDIMEYEEKGEIVEAIVGNSQLVWPFQSAVADQALEWLRGKCSLKEVLRYADEHRDDSSYF